MSRAFFGNVMAALQTSISATTISAGSSATTSSVTASAVNTRGGTLTYSWTRTGTNCTINTPSSSSTTVTGSGVGGTTELFCNIRNSVTGVAYSTPSCIITWSASTALTSAVFEYSNDGINWSVIPSPFPLGTSATYDGLSYQFRVFSVSPPGATYSSSIPSPIIDSGSTAQVSVTGTGSYTGTITSGIFLITTRTITATSSYAGALPVLSDTCNVDGTVAGFDFTLSNLVSGATGVTISIIYGTNIYNTVYGGYNFYAPTAGVGNIGYVNNQVGFGNNFVVNTNASFTIYCNENDSLNSDYWWIVVNPNEWTDNVGVITSNPAYNSNYSIVVVSSLGADAYFDNNCV